MPWYLLPHSGTPFWSDVPLGYQETDGPGGWPLPRGYKINQFHPDAETVTVKHPADIPQCLNGNGGFVPYAGNPVMVAEDEAVIDEVAWAETGLTLGVMLEDPERNRLIALCHHTHTEGAGDSGNHRIYMWAAPWGHPEGPWTRLNPIDVPLIEAGGVGEFDENVMGTPSGCIIGDKLYIAYCGTYDSTAWDKTNGKIGLAHVTLTGDEANTPVVATKTGMLEVGASPYYGVVPTLRFVDGMFYLWIARTRDGAQWATPQVPRLYTATKFNETASTPGDWTLHPMFEDWGDNPNEKAFASSPVLVGDTWVWSQTRYYSAGTLANYNGIEIHALKLGDERAIFTEYGEVMKQANAAGDFDGNRLIYHNGKWYMTYVQTPSGGNRAVRLAEWDESAGYEQNADSYISATEYFRTRHLSLAASAAQAGYQDIDATGYFHKLDWVAPIQVGRADYQIVGVNEDKTSAVAKGKARVQFWRPTAPHNHGDPTYSATDAPSGGAVGHPVEVTGERPYVITGRPI